MEQTKFKLSHTILYAKGWYLKTDDIWGDLEKVMLLDDYSTIDRNDVFTILLNAVSNSKGYHWASLRDVMTDILPRNVWKIGYPIKGNHLKGYLVGEEFFEYDVQTAFVYYVLSNFRNLHRDSWTRPKELSNRYPLGLGITHEKYLNIFNDETDLKKSMK